MVVPEPAAVTTPEASTVQMELSPLDHETPETASPLESRSRSLQYSPMRDMVTSGGLLE